MAGQHSEFGGSVIKRVIKCPASVSWARRLPPEPDSKYAADGTDAHSLADHCLSEGERSTREYVGTQFKRGDGTEFTITTEMADAVQVWLDTAWAEIDADPLAVYFVEHRVVLPVGDGQEAYGRLDLSVYQPTLRKLKILDYKHGEGVVVDVEENEQLMFYGAAELFSNDDWQVDEIELIIVQPRSWQDDRQVRRWSVGVDRLFEFMCAVDTAISAAKTACGRDLLLTDYHTGDHCKWCPAAGAAVCEAIHSNAVIGLNAVLTAPITDLRQLTMDHLPHPDEIDPAAAAALLPVFEILDAWRSQIMSTGEGLLRQGKAFPGYKLVEKVGRRKWAAEAEDVAAYASFVYGLPAEDIMPRKLVTITALEKLLKVHLQDAKAVSAAKEDISITFTVKDSEGLTMAPVSDKRDAVDAVATAVSGVVIGA